MDLRKLTDEVEAVSSTYARKHGITRDDTWFLLKLQEEVGELTQAFLMRSGQARDKGYSPDELGVIFRSELADVFSQVLLMARHHGVDLEEEVERKWMPWHPDRLSARDENETTKSTRTAPWIPRSAWKPATGTTTSGGAPLESARGLVRRRAGYGGAAPPYEITNP